MIKPCCAVALIHWTELWDLPVSLFGHTFFFALLVFIAEFLCWTNVWKGFIRIFKLKLNNCTLNNFKIKKIKFSKQLCKSLWQTSPCAFQLCWWNVPCRATLIYGWRFSMTAKTKQVFAVCTIRITTKLHMYTTQTPANLPRIGPIWSLQVLHNKFQLEHNS